MVDESRLQEHEISGAYISLWFVSWTIIGLQTWFCIPTNEGQSFLDLDFLNKRALKLPSSHQMDTKSPVHLRMKLPSVLLFKL